MFEVLNSSRYDKMARLIPVIKSSDNLSKSIALIKSALSLVLFF